MNERLRAQRLLALFALGWLLLNFPLLTIWDRAVLFAGLPLLPMALFAGWAALIGISAWICEADDEPD
jgi:hypothetical protein